MGVVVCFHECHAVGVVHDIYRLEERVLVGDVDFRLRILRSRLCGYKHDSVGSSCPVNRRGGSILENRERFDGLGGDIVQVSGGNLNSVQHYERGGASAEGVDSTDEE